MGKKQSRTVEHIHFFLVCIIITLIMISGCSQRYQAKLPFKEANDFFTRGSYGASLSRYERIIEEYPGEGDRVLFEMGIIYAHPGNPQKDYRKSLECFQRLISDYPGSVHRQDSEAMVFNINNVIFKDRVITEQQTHIEALQQEIKSDGIEIGSLQANIEALEKEVETREELINSRQNEIIKLQKEISLIRQGPADKILIEKQERRLTLLSKGNVIKTYMIALGGNPEGPKERQGDNKTPEGTYIIDSRNKDSNYHISLHISYPNDEDKRRAKRLGISPGGDIMIHGIMNGYSWIGEYHTASDWTRGCIAVTDEEIEEIDKLAPNGTIVEIKP